MQSINLFDTDARNPLSTEADDAATGAIRWHCQRHQTKARLREECSICRQVWCRLTLYLVMMFYGASVLFRNIAFYRYRGLDWYSDQVIPTEATAPLNETGAYITNISNGDRVPLISALRDEFNGGQNLNVTLPFEGESNLTSLDGRIFNLKDFAQDYFVDLSNSAFVRDMNEIVAGILQVLTFAIFFAPFFVSFAGKARPNTLAMLFRHQQTLFTANILRTLSYLSTSIPGAAQHCQSVRWTSPKGQPGGWEENRQHTLTAKDWFLDTYNFFNNCNCGDLIFSGHIATALTNVLVAQYYVGLAAPKRLGRLLIFTLWATFVLQVFCVLTTRNHYTVDVVVGIYTAFLNFVAHLYFVPKDPVPKSVG
eukprot:CAMPEP_0206587472 /NCGR_PEP_ID=MMETSP0325_2-20121206/37675_1 /ASSEMBLY_ACC=CAM_ASM_000347 /TAXON_ID=2866 /ORGANISM="Crypthecodinium cohnii, Strain Seligo" /LENGTH=366 /DNA_ID=CAMNT_0054095501 /DNA_START=32 /DNA_END=1128 /DNA_ORIENTATION=-